MSSVSKSNSVSVPFRLDPLSKVQIEYIKAQLTEIKPSGSMILRRALGIYLRHLENILDDHESLELEIINLRSAASGSPSPFKTTPDFTQYPGKKLSQMVAETNRRKVTSFLDSNPNWKPKR